MANRKRIPGWGGVWLTRLKANRWVNPDRRGLCAVALEDTAAEGTIVPRKGYGLIRFFKNVSPAGDTEWWASHDLQVTPLRRVRLAGYA